MRYKNETNAKNNGIVYTPTEMADFLAGEILSIKKFDVSDDREISILDPAIGDGELVIALARKMYELSPAAMIKINGYETDDGKSYATKEKLRHIFPNALIEIFEGNFLDEAEFIGERYDFIIANPPYVRTQILGSGRAQEIANKLQLNGRIDIYYAFLLYAKLLLKPDGVAGYITSNKFLTIKSGVAVREFMLENYQIHSIVDFGDTKLFSASVLPCIIVFSLGKTEKAEGVSFTSIYEDRISTEAKKCDSIFDYISEDGKICLQDNRIFQITHGELAVIIGKNPWTISSNENKDWLKSVDEHTWMHFSDIGKIHVGIKTTADNVFIGDNWTGEKANIELLQPLITHRDAGQIISKRSAGWKVLYTHTIIDGKRTVFDIDDYPYAKAYLNEHYDQLSGRTYLQKANRQWYEIWVPQNPASWQDRKIIFRDISEHPEFWLDDTGAIVNGDCYWIDIDDTTRDDIVYLALAVANSGFIEKYYDARFNTKLYSGKRRFMSQYVEQFPLPFYDTPTAKKAVNIVKKIITERNDANTSRYMLELNEMVDELFGVC